MFLLIGDSKGRQYFTTNKFHMKISKGEFFPNYSISSKLYDGSSLNHLSCTKYVFAWEPILLSIIGNEPQCL